MKTLLLILFFVGSITAPAADWRVALPGWDYEFPRDHAVHPEFKTEWWYFTGNLRTEDGRRFGYQLTFFRQGMRKELSQTSRFIMRDLHFAHFAMTDASGKKFRFAERTSRGAFGEAGFGTNERLAWIDSWGLRHNSDGTFHLVAENEGKRIDLRLESTKPPVIHGRDGVSQKAAGEGHASHYYSLTRLKTSGTVRFENKEFAVQGESWFDREWATNQLAADQRGWDWFSVQFENGTELMLYQMRLENGGIDDTSSGTFIDAQGRSRHLEKSDYTLTPIRLVGPYPVEWTISVPALGIEARVTTPVEQQELEFGPLAYWEGMIEVKGTIEKKQMGGRGYMELTGYRKPLDALKSR